MEKKIKKHQVWETDKEWCSALQLTIRQEAYHPQARRNKERGGEGITVSGRREGYLRLVEDCNQFMVADPAGREHRSKLPDPILLTL